MKSTESSPSVKRRAGAPAAPLGSPRRRDASVGAELAHEVADRLHSAAIHLLRGLRRVDAESGLSAARLSALSVVVFAGPLTLGELAAAEQVRPPTMSPIAGALLADGLVRRVPDPDGRRVRLRATPRGVRLMRQGRERRVARLAGLLAALAEPEVQALGEAAGLIERLLGRAGR